MKLSFPSNRPTSFIARCILSVMDVSLEYINGIIGSFLSMAIYTTLRTCKSKIAWNDVRTEKLLKGKGDVLSLFFNSNWRFAPKEPGHTQNVASKQRGRPLVNRWGILCVMMNHRRNTFKLPNLLSFHPGKNSIYAAKTNGHFQHILKLRNLLSHNLAELRSRHIRALVNPKKVVLLKRKSWDPQSKPLMLYIPEEKDITSAVDNITQFHCNTNGRNFEKQNRYWGRKLKRENYVRNE